MLVQRFVEWSRTAPVEDRVRAVAKVCEAYRFATVSPNERRTGVAVMTVALDDPSPKVRRVLSELLADCADAPRHVVAALARDIPSVAAPILHGSAAITDRELIAFVAGGDEACALAVSGRANLSPDLARAVIEHGGADAVLKVLDHPSLALSPEALRRIAARFGDDAAVRARLLAADGIDDGTHRALRAAHAASLYSFAESRGWLSPRRSRALEAKARERDLLHAASHAAPHELDALVSTAVHDGALTASLMLRAAVCGQLGLVERAVAVLSGNPLSRTRAALRSDRRTARDAVLARAGLDGAVGRLVVSAYRIWCEEGRHALADAQAEGTRVLRKVVRTLSVEAGCDAPAAVTRLLSELELEIERHAALYHEEQLLLAA